MTAVEGLPHQPPNTRIPLLVFHLHNDRFALRASNVREVTRAAALARLPDAPAIVDGVLNLRGDVIPVLDMRRRFGGAIVTLSPDQHFIIATAGSRLLGLRVDRVSALVDVAADSITSAGEIVPGSRYASGIARLPDGLLVIHDLERFLSHDEVIQLDVALAESQ